jgi:hypothetical protein
MNYGLLMPCKLIQVIDAATFVIGLPGQVEITVHLAGVEPIGITSPEKILWIESQLAASKPLACWLPQPKHDRGWFLGLKAGSSFAGDLVLFNKNFLSLLLIKESIVVRLQGNREWRASEWVQTWQL